MNYLLQSTNTCPECGNRQQECSQEMFIINKGKLRMVTAWFFRCMNDSCRLEFTTNEQDLKTLAQLGEPWASHWKNFIQNETELLSCPGDSLLVYMKHKNYDVTMTALAMNISLKDTNALLSGEYLIDATMAAKLEKFSEIDAQFWINREQAYRDKLEWIKIKS